MNSVDSYTDSAFLGLRRSSSCYCFGVSDGKNFGNSLLQKI